MTDWRNNLVADRAGARSVLRTARRIAVVGIKPETRSNEPAHYVPAYLKQAGYEVVPVPCYYPEVTSILGSPVYRDLAQVPGHVDLVVLFRRSGDVPAHVTAILALAPDAVWFQSGIRNDQAAEELARAGILVVQDRCTMVEHRALRTGPP